MQKMQEGHRDERAEWTESQSKLADKAEANAEKVTEKLTDILIAVSKRN